MGSMLALEVEVDILTVCGCGVVLVAFDGDACCATTSGNV